MTTEEKIQFAKIFRDKYQGLKIKKIELFEMESYMIDEMEKLEKKYKDKLINIIENSL